MSTSLGPLENAAPRLYPGPQRPISGDRRNRPRPGLDRDTGTRTVLSRLVGKGVIARVRRGLYLLPLRLPPGGRWSPGEFLALSTLIADRGGTYQISGPNTFYRYGWSEQIPNRLGRL